MLDTPLLVVLDAQDCYTVYANKAIMLSDAVKIHEVHKTVASENVSKRV